MTSKTLGRELKALDAMNNLRVVDDKNNSRSHELKPLHVVNRLGQWMILTILCHELKVVDVML